MEQEGQAAGDDWLRGWAELEWAGSVGAWLLLDGAQVLALVVGLDHVRAELVVQLERRHFVRNFMG